MPVFFGLTAIVFLGAVPEAVNADLHALLSNVLCRLSHDFTKVVFRTCNNAYLARTVPSCSNATK